MNVQCLSFKVLIFFLSQDCAFKLIAANFKLFVLNLISVEIQTYRTCATVFSPVDQPG